MINKSNDGLSIFDNFIVDLNLLKYKPINQSESFDTAAYADRVSGYMETDVMNANNITVNID